MAKFMEDSLVIQQMVPPMDKGQLLQESCQPWDGVTDITLALATKCQTMEGGHQIPLGQNRYPQPEGAWKKSVGSSSGSHTEIECGPK